MSRENTPADQGEQSVNYAVVESAIQDAQDHLADAEEGIDNAFNDDLADIRRRLKQIENAVDESQDDEESQALGIVPAQLDYIQRAVEILQEQTGHDVLDDVERSLEAVEEHTERSTIEKTRWFAEVDGSPEVFSEKEVQAHRLKKVGDISGQSENYTLYAVPTPTASPEDKIAEFPADDNRADLVDVGPYFLTEKAEGGVV
ncbi:hypothetical protein [Halanaeroarchaeum sp. HSR-CO]|uniref:hypothetical protein n=1 Tax=Halanaeroarchaeum sp. HSR-CO TaxID=2866382 RepID=UPI00217ED603|nr:hypothetical protein [Halanaeroarchaeum sp. HSR-CO]